MTGEQILVVDDDEATRFVLTERLRDAGYCAGGASNGSEALDLVRAEGVPVVLLDYRLPDMSGLELLDRIKAESPSTSVVMITAYSSVSTAVEAMKRGAADYATKPIDFERLIAMLKDVERRSRSEAPRSAPSSNPFIDCLVGPSEVMTGVKRLMTKVAESPVPTILLTGESGTGKDLAARALHAASPRAERPFINITCSALPDALLESELFGHEAGAFTSAARQKKGLLELADGGTVFLDEIGEMAPALQAKLLRFLEERAFRRVGGTRDISVDVRVIAATNRDLAQAVAAREFRADLYYRLRVVVVHLPPLRERKEDIPALAESFIAEFNRLFEKDVQGLHPASLSQLMASDWPGNVRELKHTVEQAMLLADGPLLSPQDFTTPLTKPEGSPFRLPPQGLVLEHLERSLVEQALEITGWNRVRAAKLLGLNRDQIRYRIEKFGLCRS